MPTPYALSSDLVSAYPAKSLAIAQYVDGYKLDTGPEQNAQTGTTYTFLLTDTVKTVTANNTAASAYAVPPQASVVWEAYTVLRLLNLGAGVVTLTAGAGVTITGTLTVAQYSSATLVRTASDTWTVAGSGTASGMDLITPTSVAGTGVTLSGGKVIYSVASTVSINGCFTSTYDNYLIFVNGFHSIETVGQIRLRLAGADSSAASYQNQRFSARGVTLEGTSQTGVTSGQVTASSTSDKNAFRLDMFGPALAQNTKYISHCDFGSDKVEIYGGGHIVATAYDGFTLFPTSGTMTGSLRIYGLRN
tara:strand:- start:55 stop:969 length:915 start_codon:yes stop_codon:yes gene_type:complete